ncbi:MAG TPA: hypothetical protein VH637_20725 [Streptosporangiaceae bacterium]|jgi:hypothetical protein
MSNQVEPGTIGAAPEPAESGHRQQLAGLSQEPDSPWSPPRPYHGRTVSWVAVSLIMVAFLIGGLALIFGPTWWLFWVSIGIAAVGGLIALFTNIFEDWY